MAKKPTLRAIPGGRAKVVTLPADTRVTYTVVLAITTTPEDLAAGMGYLDEILLVGEEHGRETEETKPFAGVVGARVIITALQTALYGGPPDDRRVG
jgi:hypothetical protein